MSAPFLGDGASFGADGGPISARNDFNTGFSTGAFGTRDGLNTLSLAVMAAAILGGVALWAWISNR